MFTVENPCQSEADLERFAAWWKNFTGLDVGTRMLQLKLFREEIEAMQKKITDGLKSRLTLTLSQRAEIGSLQDLLVPKLGQLSKFERSNPYVQPEMILAVPRVDGFWIQDDVFWFQTKCLYGRAQHPVGAPWCEIGRMRIQVSKGSTKGIPYIQTEWENLDRRCIVVPEMPPVPAPQVDDNGKRGCMGYVTPNFMKDGRESGRIDVIVASLIRYTEYPNPTAGMGEFPEVSDEHVPEFYLKTFPR